MTLAMVRTQVLTVTFASVVLDDVLSAQGQISADRGWPTCSVFVTAKPDTGNEEDLLTVVAGTSNIETRFVGRVRAFRPTAFPKTVEMRAMGSLAYASEWAPSEDTLFDETFPSGATDQQLVQWVLGQVPGITYSSGNIGGTGTVLGISAPEAFDWKARTTAWSYIQQLDRATLFRTYQAHDGTIYRVQMIGHPHGDPVDFTLEPEDVLATGSTATRSTEATRNNVIVRGHDYGDSMGGGVQGVAMETAIPGTPDRWELFSSDLIEDGNDEDGAPTGWTGLNAQTIASAIIADVNKEFVEASVTTWRDDLHGPGMTCQLNTLDRLLIGEKMWVQDYSWEIGERGWTTTYGLTGGGLEQDYTPPPV